MARKLKTRPRIRLDDHQAISFGGDESIRVLVTDEDGDVIARGIYPTSGPYLLAVPQSESRDPDDHAVHAFDEAGEHLWTLPVRPADDPVSVPGGILVITHATGRRWGPVEQPPLKAILVEPMTGAPVLERPLPIPAELEVDYIERARTVLARVKTDGDEVVVRVTGTPRSGFPPPPPFSIVLRAAELTGPG